LISADTVEVEDLGSRHGTLLNGSKCTRAKLSDGDILTVGTTEIRVRIVALVDDITERVTPTQRPDASAGTHPIWVLIGTQMQGSVGEIVQAIDLVNPRAKKNRNLLSKSGFLHIRADFVLKARASASN
jgi:pSer/pThr/pTyr-binding forkhead associated (FHA) protein